MTASGLVSTKLNKNANLHAARGFKAEDFVITPISEEEAKARTSGLKTGEAGDGGGFTMMAQCSEGFLPYTKSNLVDDSGKPRDFELENGKGYNYCTVDQCLKPGVIAYFRDGTITGEVPETKLKALEKSLAKNALTADGFMPGNGFTFFHSTGDEVVPYCNLESVRNTWGTGGIKTVTLESYVQLHVATGTLFFTMKCGSLVDEILNGSWAPGEYIVGI